MCQVYGEWERVVYNALERRQLPVPTDWLPPDEPNTATYCPTIRHMQGGFDRDALPPPRGFTRSGTLKSAPEKPWAWENTFTVEAYGALVCTFDAPVARISIVGRDGGGRFVHARRAQEISFNVIERTMSGGNWPVGHA